MNGIEYTDLNIDTFIDDGTKFGDWIQKKLTYNLLCKEFRSSCFVRIYGKYATYTIEQFNVNH